MKNIYFLKITSAMNPFKQFSRLGSALVVLLILISQLTAFSQNDVVIRNFMNSAADIEALDAAFDNVIGVYTNPNGNPITYNGTNDNQFAISRTIIPDNVAAYAGVDMVFMSEGPDATLSQAQVDALVDFVFQGGIFVGNFEETTITNPRNGINPAYVGAYLANTFICSDTYVMHTFGDGDNNQGAGESQTCVTPFPYHPGEGNLNLTAPGWDNTLGGSGLPDLSASKASWYVGVPPENAVLYCDADLDDVVGSSGANATCNNTAVLDMVFPAYPGTPNACGIQGMAFISGETSTGILQDGNLGRGNLQYNRNWAQLAYDFLYDPVAMADRNDWSANAANVNPTCPTALPVVGTIDCSKTQLATAPVAGEPGQKTLTVTIDVTTAGCFSPLTVSGSGMSLANSVTEVCTATTGLQTFSIPVAYDGTALGTLTFEVGTGNSCTADLTTTPKQSITPIYTLDCVPTAGPSLK